MPRKRNPPKEIVDVGPFWPKDWPRVPMVDGPGVHQIRLYGGSSTSYIAVHCCCGADLGAISPAKEESPWPLFRAHEREVNAPS